MLTGLELYYWERAGYFARRGVLTPEETAAWQNASECDTLRYVLAHPGVLTAIEDLLPTGACLRGAVLRTEAGESLPWGRDAGPTLDAPDTVQVAALARLGERVEIRAALLEDVGLCVLPGTHAAPPLVKQVDALRADPSGDVAGQVRVRLASGDLLFLGRSLLRRDTAEPSRPRRTQCLSLAPRFHAGAERTAERIPAWLSDPAFRDDLPPAARRLLDD